MALNVVGESKIELGGDTGEIVNILSTIPTDGAEEVEFCYNGSFPEKSIFFDNPIVAKNFSNDIEKFLETVSDDDFHKNCPIITSERLLHGLTYRMLSRHIFAFSENSTNGRFNTLL